MTPRRRSTPPRLGTDPVVTIVVAGFPPAYRYGGPTKSTAGLVSRLGHEYEFRVVTSAFDSGCAAPLEHVAIDTWTRHGACHVFYATFGVRQILRFLRLIDHATDGVVLLNSFFSPKFGLGPLLYLSVFRRDVSLLVAPRGELAVAALSHHPKRKRVTLALIRASRLHKRVSWQASSATEMDEIKRHLGQHVTVWVARNLSEPLGGGQVPASPVESPASDVLRIGFMSRIAPKKNLDGLLEALKVLDRPAQLDIAGPTPDPEYWAQCERLIADLGDEITVRHLGPMPPDQIMRFLQSIDLFVLPTHGENYGHAIAEALLAGRPIVVGSQTPWASIEEQGAGWLCDSRSPSDIANKIRRVMDATPSERAEMGRRSRTLGTTITEDTDALEANRVMLSSLVDRARGHGDSDQDVVG